MKEKTLPKKTKPKEKAKGRFFKFKKPLDSFLAAEAKKSSKTMTVILEELLAFRASFKQWPPVEGGKR